MKPKFTLVLKFILGLVITTNVVAQTAKNYNILLNSGSFIPEKNIDNLTNENSIFQKSEFNNSYYVVLQFNELPNDISKSKLKDAGIILKDYIPNLCFTSVISKNFDLQVLKQQNIRSIFQLTSEQKTVPIIMAGQIPSHAIKSQYELQHFHHPKLLYLLHHPSNLLLHRLKN